MAETHATLNGFELRLRPRQGFSSSGYKKRPVTKPRPRLINDITDGFPKPVISPKLPPAKAIANPRTFANPAPPRQRSHSTVLRRSAVQPPHVSLPNKKAQRSKAQLILLAAIIVIIASGAFLTFSGWRANRAVQAQASQLTKEANKNNADGGGVDALSTVKPNLASYYVSPYMPRYITIPSLNVKARVLSAGVTSSGALDTPNDIYDTDWYNESSLPGQAGAMLIDGHSGIGVQHGIFHDLPDLKSGNAITITRGDGKIFNYKVVKVKIYNSSNVDMAAALTPIVPNESGLNLISCDGGIIPGTNELSERVVVFATQI